MTCAHPNACLPNSFFYNKTIDNCVDSGNELVCTCKVGYTGDKCQTKGCFHLNNCSGFGNVFLIN